MLVRYLCTPMLAMLLALALPVPAKAGEPPTNAGVQAVVESFRAAILDKDRDAFLGLFLDAPITWQSVRTDIDLTRKGNRDKPPTKVAYRAENTPARFIDGIVASSSKLEETIDDVRIATDGDVASVTFQYRFLKDGREMNRGLEAWHLLRTDAGWRIASVVWSVTAPPDA